MSSKSGSFVQSEHNLKSSVLGQRIFGTGTHFDSSFNI
jgi:hypothetical protein